MCLRIFSLRNTHSIDYWFKIYIFGEKKKLTCFFLLVMCIFSFYRIKVVLKMLTLLWNISIWIFILSSFSHIYTFINEGMDSKIIEENGLWTYSSVLMNEHYFPFLSLYIYIYTHTHTHTYIYIYISSSSCRAVCMISLTLSCHPSQSSIALGRSSYQHPILSQSCCI